MTRKKTVRFYLKTKFKSLIYARKNYGTYIQDFYVNQILGATSYMHMTGDISEETQRKILNLVYLTKKFTFK